MHLVICVPAPVYPGLHVTSSSYLKKPSLSTVAGKFGY